MALAVPIPRTWNVGDLETAALFNSQIRDAFTFALNPPLFTGRQTVAQSIPNTTYTAITIDTADVDTYSGWATGSNTRYTAQVAGYYLLTGQVSMTPSAQSHRVEWMRNGSVISGSQTIPVVGGATSAAADVAAIVTLAYMSVNDYIQMAVYQDTGAALSTAIAVGRVPLMNALWVHA